VTDPYPLLWISLNAVGPDPKWDQPVEMAVGANLSNMEDFKVGAVKRSVVQVYTDSEDPFTNPEYKERYVRSGLYDYWHAVRAYKKWNTHGSLAFISILEKRIINLFDTRQVTDPLVLSGAEVGSRVLPYLKVWMPNLVDRLAEHTFDTSIIRQEFNRPWPDRALPDMNQAYNEGWELARAMKMLRREAEE
jgi:hypothetical protein